MFTEKTPFENHTCVGNNLWMLRIKMRKYIWKWTEIIENKRKKHTKIESLESKHSFSKKRSLLYKKYLFVLWTIEHMDCVFLSIVISTWAPELIPTISKLHQFQINYYEESSFFLYTDFLFISINFVIYKFSTIKPVNDGIRISLFAANIFDYNT